MSAPLPRPAPLALAAALSLSALLGPLLAGCGDDTTQCERDGNPQACARACAAGVNGEGGCLKLGDLYASGERVWRSAQVAAMYHEMACKAGEPRACERLSKAPEADRPAGSPAPSPRGSAAASAEPPSAAGSTTPPPAAASARPSGDDSTRKHHDRCPPAGDGAEGELPEALKALEQRCQVGDGVSCGTVADKLWQGAGVARDRARAAKLWVLGCERHDAASCRAAGRAYEKGVGVGVDTAQAISLYQRACLGAFVAGCSALGELSLSGAPGAPPVNMGVGHLQKACDRAYAPACLAMASALREGKQVPANAAVADRLTARGLEILEAGCKRGEAEACTTQFRTLDEAGNAEGAAQAETRLASACSGGDAPACSAYLELPSHKAPLQPASLQAACAANLGLGCLSLAEAARTDPSLGAPADLLDRACKLGVGEGDAEGRAPSAPAPASSAPASASASPPSHPPSNPSGPAPSSASPPAAGAVKPASPPPLPDEPSVFSCSASPPRPSSLGVSSLGPGLFALALGALGARRRRS